MFVYQQDNGGNDKSQICCVEPEGETWLGEGGATSSFLVDHKGGLGCARIGTNFTQAGNLKLESFQGYR